MGNLPTKTPTRPVLRYHGGKWKLAKWLLSHFPEHKVYTEVFGGAGSVLMRKQRSYAEVYNDRWDIVTNVFQVLRDKESAAELERQIRLTPFSRKEFDQCGDIEIAAVKCPIERARRTIFRSFAGFGSAATNAKRSTGFRSNSNRSGTTPAHDWRGYPDHINSFVKRLQGVVIENLDYKRVLKQHDQKDTLHYLDPPYVHSTRNMKRGNAAYAYEMTDENHAEMATQIEKLKGMVIISGYDCDLYRKLFPAEKGWKMIKRKAHADGAKERIECLWLNKRAQIIGKQKTIFD